MTVRTTLETDVHSRSKSIPVSKAATDELDAIPPLAKDVVTISRSTIMEKGDDNDDNHGGSFSTMMESESSGSSSDHIDINGPLDTGGCSNSEDYDCVSSRPQHQRRIIFPREETSGLRRRLARTVDQPTNASANKENKPWTISQKDSFISNGAVLHSDATLSASSSMSSLLCNTYGPLDREDSYSNSDAAPRSKQTAGFSTVSNSAQRNYSSSSQYSSDQLRTTVMTDISTVNNPASHDPPPTFPKSTLYTYSQDSCAGRMLTRLSDTFIKPHRLDQHTQHQLSQQQENNKTIQQLNTNTSSNDDINIRAGSAFAGFLSLLLTTCASYMLSPMRDAAALAVGVSHIPTLTLASTVLALGSSVPMGWLFEAPNGERPWRVWRGKYGLTRGDTQGTSLALFYRVFAIFLVGYAFTFMVFELFGSKDIDGSGRDGMEELSSAAVGISNDIKNNFMIILSKFGKIVYVAFFLVVHLMKLHSISLIWGVAQEAMEYEEQAKIRETKRNREIISRGFGNFNDVGDRTITGRVGSSGSISSMNKVTSKGKRSGTRLKRLAFVGFGGTLGGILGSVFVYLTAKTLRLQGLLVVAAILLLLSAELSIELGQIMLRHWNEGKEEEKGMNTGQTYLGSKDKEQNEDDIVSLVCSIASAASNSIHEMSVMSVNNNDEKDLCLGSAKDGIMDSSLKKTVSMGSMKRVTSNNSMGNIRRAQSATAILDMIKSGDKNRNKDRSISFSNDKDEIIDTSLKKVNSLHSMKRVASGNSISKIDNGEMACSDPCNEGRKGDMKSRTQHDQNLEQELDNNSFKQRLLRGITTIIQSRLLMTIFTYNALYATTTVLLSFQRAELVANRSSSTSNHDVASDAAFLAKINIASGMAVFALQASGLGAFIANSCGQRGTLSIMPIVRLLTVALLALWHVKAGGEPPNLILFLILDEFTKVVNFSVAKPVRESLWSDLSNEARYEAKPIVDTLANRWGGGSAAFLMALLDQIMLFTGLGEVLADGTKNLFGFPPLLFLLSISTVWWTFVSIDLGNIRRIIDLELKKQE